jgi:hypothetical protein
MGQQNGTAQTLFSHGVGSRPETYSYATLFGSPILRSPGRPIMMYHTHSANAGPHSPHTPFCEAASKSGPRNWGAHHPGHFRERPYFNAMKCKNGPLRLQASVCRLVPNCRNSRNGSSGLQPGQSPPHKRPYANFRNEVLLHGARDAKKRSSSIRRGRCHRESSSRSNPIFDFW